MRSPIARHWRQHDEHMRYRLTPPVLLSEYGMYVVFLNRLLLHYTPRGDICSSFKSPERVRSSKILEGDWQGT